MIKKKKSEEKIKKKENSKLVYFVKQETKEVC